MNGFGGEDSDGLFIEVDKNQPGVPLVTTTATITAPPAAASTTAATTPAASPDTSTEPQTEPANNFFAASSPRTMPADGEIINEYSDGELVKSQTLNLWQTHDGVDIAAEIGTDIKACGEGKILNIWEDALWGVCVSIDHGDGHISSVFGLDPNVPVSMGHTWLKDDLKLITSPAETEKLASLGLYNLVGQAVNHKERTVEPAVHETASRTAQNL